MKLSFYYVDAEYVQYLKDIEFNKRKGGSHMLSIYPACFVKGMPFQSKHPTINHFSAQDITKSKFDAELQKGVDSIKNGRTHSVEDVDRTLAEEFGI